MSIIAFITDFGTNDHFVGSMKGAILGIDPNATLVDITHAIAPGDVSSAALALLLSFSDFLREIRTFFDQIPGSLFSHSFNF